VRCVRESGNEREKVHARGYIKAKSKKVEGVSENKVDLLSECCIMYVYV